MVDWHASGGFGFADGAQAGAEVGLGEGAEAEAGVEGAVPDVAEGEGDAGCAGLLAPGGDGPDQATAEPRRAWSGWTSSSCR
ncbi:MAG: hypothetical protein U0841_10835 [Chloroflexia bacterium]